MKNSLIKKSKFLSLVLRHQPSAAFVELDPEGWVCVDALLAGARRAGKFMSVHEINEIVATNEKKRFALSEDGTRIRANQGHSVKVDLGMQEAKPPEVLFHGTAMRNVESIFANGLEKQSRQHVHLSADEVTAHKVGSRHGKPVILHVEAARMEADGFVFYLSENHVWLTDQVPPQYITPLEQ